MTRAIDLLDLVLPGSADQPPSVAVAVAAETEIAAVSTLASRLAVGEDEVWFAAWALLLARLHGVDRVVVGWGGPPADAPGLQPREVRLRESVPALDWLCEVALTAGVGVPYDAPVRSAWAAPFRHNMPPDADRPALVWRRGPGGLVGHATPLVDAKGVARLGELLLVVVRSLLANPALSGVDPLTPADRERVIVDWNRTARGYRPEATVHGLFRERAASNPDAVALLWDGGRLTYGDLDRRSDALAERLVAAGVVTDAAVALGLDRSAEAVIALLGILKAGGAYLPLDAGHPRERLAFMIADSGIQVLVTDAARRDRFESLAAHTIYVDEASPGDVTAQPPRVPPVMPTSRAYIMYTSGSTGTPKGVQVEHRSVVRLVGDVDYVRLGPDVRFLQAAPLGFDASTLELWGPLLHGGTCVLFTDPMPTGPALARAIAAHGVTTAWLTAALFNAVVDLDPTLLRGLRQLFTGGEALSPGHVRKALAALPDVELVNGYGPTECTTFTATYRIPHDLPADVRSVPIGKPIADTQVFVVNQCDAPVPIGVVGELLVGGAGVARGYVNRPELDAERFVLRGGRRLYRTGDRVRWRSEGLLEYVGRLDGQVKIRGFRIELGEVEAAIAQCPDVLACAVIARDGGAGDRRLVAYVVPRDGQLAQPALRAAVAERLPEFMVPSAFVSLAALPVTANGKLDRAALPEPAGRRPDLAQPYRAPIGEPESSLCRVFADLLGLDRVGTLDGFFELGGNSLLSLRLLEQLRREGLPEISPADFFAAPTPAGLARAVTGSQRRRRPTDRRPRIADEPIAVIGMAGRFPGAGDVETFWRNLCDGRESIRFFTPEEIDPGIPLALSRDPAYVRARGVLDDVEMFDAAFFGMSPLEAQLTDPQHRHFLEVAWHALEHSGHVPDPADGPIGVFGGAHNATYFQRHVLPRPEMSGRLGDLQVMLGNEKDYLTSRVAYKLGLTGPAVSVSTACSTSLVAAAMAMDSLRAGRCDLALAGGVAITCPPRSGHLHQEGAIASPDGHTRTFDARASGTVFSDGVAMVVLRRLSDAIADGDTIYAVMLGAGVNNDGSDRASFTAPSPEGQAEVIAAALDAAQVDARSVSYVEAHGTATPLGDPIEIEGLTRAFSDHTPDRGFCAVGSLKSNVGHLTIAAGAASLIKTSLALSRGVLPPSIGVERVNPAIDFARTPFRVLTTLTAWPAGSGPRRAGVSAFGFGGTNAHVVLEEPPPRPLPQPSPRPSQLLMLSARTPAALAEAGLRLRRHLTDEPGLDLADVAHTLRVGRHGFDHRRFVVASTVAQAAALLEAPAAPTCGARQVGAELPEVGFLCPGQGSQYPAMGHGLYRTEPAFRAAYDQCCQIIEAATGSDPRPRFFSSDPDALSSTAVTQPAIFALEYALARLWISWGVRPASLIGHSVGEFVCAALAEVMSLEDTLGLVVERGRSMQALPAGSMLSVRLGAGALEPQLPPGTAIAAENGPELSVVSGPTERISGLESSLSAAGVVTRRLVTSHAFHSAMMDPVVPVMAARLATLTLRPPRIPILSTVTADWLSDAEATSPTYWAEHLRRPVRFAPAVARLLAERRRLLIEVGPRASLSTLARQGVTGARTIPVAIASLADSVERESEAAATALGQLWSLGASIDWSGYGASERRRRIALPAYPFERQRHWIEAPAAAVASPPGQAPLTERGPTLEPMSPRSDPAGTTTPAVPAASSPPRRERLLARVRDFVEEVSGVTMTDGDVSTPWLELGLDSLTLTQLALHVQRATAVKVTFRHVMESYTSAAALAALLDDSLPAEAALDPAAPALSGQSTGDEPARRPPPTSVAGSPVPSARPGDESAGPVAYDVKKAFGAIARIHTKPDALTHQQRARLDALVARYTARTARSKAYTARHRRRMADPRVVNGFRPLTKELTYQIVIARSQGSRLWDLDGNEYIDVLNGFGMNLFGWQPEFLRDAVHRQVDLGYEIGPQHVLAGEVAELFCEVTGHDRVAFCNTGSEAVMGAMRIARTVTGRSTIAIFTGAYHGIFDEVIVRGTRSLKTIPAAPGILPASSQNILVLDYGTPESLEILRQRADDLAAIVVEPVQSRRPDFQPVEFLRQLRQLTRASGALLIFDEVVTGFRAHQRGAQGLFDIDADLASYGKVVGGGFSIGVIAGKTPFMDALDGGHWDYGDASVPTVGVTYFAGTFVRHPLALAAAKASLQHIRDAGPMLQEQLTARTAAMVAEINGAMTTLGAPFRLSTFASLWRNVFTEDLAYADLIYAMLRDRGIHILDNFPCFLTTAHGDDDIAAIVRAYGDAAAEMVAAGFFPARRPGVAVADVAAAGAGRIVPSTEPQREVWLADRLGPEASLAYNEAITLDLRGELEIGAWRQAVRALPARHDALRATFAADGLSMHVPAEPFTLEVPLHDLAALPAATRDATYAAIRARHVSEPFDLTTGPLVRAEIVRLAADHHALVFSGHHIILDGWSYWVIVKDLAALYARAIGARSAPLLPAPSFADHAAAEAARADSAALRANESWWVEQFAAGVPVLELPTDRSRPALRTQASGRHDHTLPAELVAAVKTLGARYGTSLFTTLLGAFAAFLSRLTGQDDLIVGIPAAGQAATGQEGLVGHCVSMLPIRVRPARTMLFSELIATTRAAILDAYDHQEVTFGRVLQLLPLSRDPGRLPLISVIFNIDQALTGEGQSAPGLALELASIPRRSETFELFVNAVDGGPAGMRLECQFNAELFDATTAARWLAGFETLLRAAVSDPDRTVGRLTVATEAERRTLMAWNQTESSYPRDARVEELIAATVRRLPDRPAVRTSGGTLTYAELDARVQAIAGALGDRAMAGARVGLLLERDEHLVPAVIGTMTAGAAYVPLDPAFPAERVAFMIRDAGLALVVTTRAVASRLAATIGAVPVLCLDEFPPSAAATSRSTTAAGSAGATDDAYVIYTSGSTGTPKGVCVPHRGVVNLLCAMAGSPGLTERDVMLAVTTLSFDIAVLELMLPLVVGAQVVVARREDAVDGIALRRLLDTHHVTTLQATPATWRLLLDAGWTGDAGFTALCGGEALPRDLANTLAGRVGALWNLYGPTETTIWSSIARVHEGGGSVPIGRPIANTTIHVLDEDCQPAPLGAVGELYIGGDGVTGGYLGRPELTAERFVADPFRLETGARLYRTGDLGRWRADGQLECLGRTDFQIKLRGYRIELGEIETALAAQPGVAEAVVTTREERAGDVRLVAYFVPRGVPPAVEALRNALARVLPEHMVPTRFVALERVPLTPNGKVDRKALPAPAGAAAVGSVAPRSATEERVERAFAEALALPRLSIYDDFFALGGHSLLAAQMTARLGQDLNRAVPMRVAFEHPTVAALAAWIDGAAVAESSPPRIPQRLERGPAPLSLMQHRVWYLEQLQPGRTVFNVPSAHRLVGALDLDALTAAVRDMVRSQAALRTVIDIVGDTAAQVVRDDIEVELPVEDLSHLPDDACEAELARRLDDQAAHRFDLARGPLFRVRLFRLAAANHVLFFMAHHAIWDGWSFDLFYEEMSERYAAHRAGRAANCAPPAVSYADFAAWHRAWMTGPELARQLEYWQTKLAGAPDALDLPTDRPRPAIQSGDGATEWLKLPALTVEGLRAAGRNDGATLFMTLLAAWAMLLFRTTGQRDLVIGTPVRGRNHPELESVIGFFVNALPLRLSVDPDQDFPSLLRAVRGDVIAGFGFQDVPFEHLVRVMNVPRDESRFPIYQSFFSYQDARRRPPRWGNLEHHNLPLFQPAAAQDVALWFLDNVDGVVGGLNYNTDIIEPATAAAMARRFLALAEAIATDPRRSVGALLSVSADERAQLNEWNATAVTIPLADSLGAYLMPRLASGGSRIAIRARERAISYDDLSAAARRVAATLQSRGVGRGDVVALHLQRSPEMLAALLGVCAAGATYVPLDPEFPAARLRFMVTDSAARLVVSDGDPTTFGVDAGRILPLDRALEGNDTAATAAAAQPEDAAYLIYTSGSTGGPKGVRVPGRAIVNFLSSMQRTPGLMADDRLLAVTTLSFDIAVLELLLPLTVGAEIVLASREDAIDGHALRRLIEEHQVTVMQATPATWRLLLEAGWRGESRFRALCGGEVLPGELAAQLVDRVGELWNMYGPTETTVWSTCARVDEGRTVTIGRPIDNTQAWILDDAGALVPIGVAGELCLGGDGVALGYHDRPSLTAERFVPDPFSSRPGARLYRTGDIARWRHDGQLQHLGRRDFQVKVRGYRIELGEIEAALARHAGVAQAVVTSPQGAGGAATLVAHVVCRDGATVAPADLREHLRGELPDYMIPSAFSVVERVPLTPNGKVDRQALSARGVIAAAPAHGTFTAPRSASEHTVAAVWRELLHTDRIDVLDNFLDLGGHSLLIMQAVTMLEARTGRRLSPRAFVFQSLEQLAHELDAGAPPSPAPAARRSGLLKRFLSSLKP